MHASHRTNGIRRQRKLIDLHSLSNLIGMSPSSILLVVWPPYCEDSLLDVDVSLAMSFDGLNFQHLHISKDDNWTPVLSDLHINPKFVMGWSEYSKRIPAWMSGDLNGAMTFEFYNVIDNRDFQAFLNPIEDIELISLSGDQKPFGVKLIFKDDFIIVTPNSDGTTIETSKFNRLDNLSVFCTLGDLVFKSLISRC